MQQAAKHQARTRTGRRSVAQVLAYSATAGSSHPAGRMAVGEKDGKHSSAERTLDLATNADGTAVLLNDAARYPQSQSGPTIFLGCVEGLEDAAQALGRDAAAVV